MLLLSDTTAMLSCIYEFCLELAEDDTYDVWHCFDTRLKQLAVKVTRKPFGESCIDVTLPVANAEDDGALALVLETLDNLLMPIIQG